VANSAGYFAHSPQQVANYLRLYKHAGYGYAYEFPLRPAGGWGQPSKLCGGITMKTWTDEEQRQFIQNMWRKHNVRLETVDVPEDIFLNF
jgi:hypothetical protein